MEKDYDLILSISKDIIKNYNNFINKKDYKNCSYEQFKTKMEEQYNEFIKDNNNIFEKCVSGQMDINILSYMINQAKQIQKNKISNYDASVKVGEKLVDKFIKPLMQKEKEKEKEK
jgi:hypothetical protein